MKNSLWACCSLLATLSLGAFVSQVHADADTQYWSSVNLSTKINDQFNMLGEWIYRYSDDKDQAVTESVRLGVGYKFTENWTYSFLTENRHTDNDANDELRFIHQFSRPWQLDWAKLAFRGRLENRRFSDTPVWMLRLRAQGRIELTSLSIGKFTPILSTEYFHITNDVGSREAGSNELRNVAGFMFPALGGSVEVAYMDRRQKAPNKAESRYQIANLVVRLSF